MSDSKDYTVTGNGVAHRTADSYMRDPKVRKFLERNVDEPGGLLCGYFVEQDDAPLTAKYKGEGSYGKNKNS